MKVEIENLNGHFKKLSIEIPAEIVSAKIGDHFKNIQKEANLKGFRKGKAPIDLVRQTYGDSETPRVTRQIVEEYLNKALLEHALSPVATPEIDLSAPVLEGASFKFSATFENLPPVELKDYTSFKPDRKPIEVSEEDIQGTLKSIQQQLTRINKTEDGTVITESHVAQVSYEGFENGEKLAQASQENAFVEPGTGQLLAEFEKNILGLKKGDQKEFSFVVKGDADKGPHPLEGKNITFKVTINEVFTKDAPAIDDELAKKAGPFKDLAELRARVTEEVKMQKEQQQRRELQEQAVEWLTKNNPIETPETLVNQQIQNLAIEAGMQLQQMGLSQEQIEERLKEWADDMNTRANTQVRASLLLGAIARKEKIQVQDEDIRKEIARLANQSRRNPQDIVKDMQERNLIPGFMRQVQELKALEWLIDRGTSEKAV